MDGSIPIWLSEMDTNINTQVFSKLFFESSIKNLDVIKSQIRDILYFDILLHALNLRLARECEGEKRSLSFLHSKYCKMGALPLLYLSKTKGVKMPKAGQKLLDLYNSDEPFKHANDATAKKRKYELEKIQESLTPSSETIFRHYFDGIALENYSDKKDLANAKKALVPLSDIDKWNFLFFSSWNWNLYSQYLDTLHVKSSNELNKALKTGYNKLDEHLKHCVQLYAVYNEKNPETLISKEIQILSFLLLLKKLNKDYRFFAMHALSEDSHLSRCDAFIHDKMHVEMWWLTKGKESACMFLTEHLLYNLRYYLGEYLRFPEAVNNKSDYMRNVVLSFIEQESYRLSNKIKLFEDLPSLESIIFNDTCLEVLKYTNLIDISLSEDKTSFLLHNYGAFFDKSTEPITIFSNLYQNPVARLEPEKFSLGLIGKMIT